MHYHQGVKVSELIQYFWKMQEITALIDREKKVIMDWSPKSGCTIAVKMFFRQMGLFGEGSGV